MGIQTMLLQGGGGGGQRSQIQSLARQGSLYNLTLNEVQSHLGEPLNSMNLGELLKSVFAGDANQSGETDLGGNSGQCAQTSSLQCQGSITMPWSLSKMTVDEVWRDIQQGHRKSSKEPVSGQEERMTLGEMTLKDFLVKAGVVAEDSAQNKSDLFGDMDPVGTANPVAGAHDSAQGEQWLQQYYQMSSMDQQQQSQQNLMETYMPRYPVQQAMNVGASPVLDAMYTEGQVSLSSPTVGTLSDPQTSGRKQAASGEMTEKLVDRRLKRMIKNRESAARSRARKQAYTHELENKVSHLEEENERLKKQKKLDEILYVPSPEPKYQLRRTTSTPF